ncbi:hypothetical protein J2Y67_005396 [Neobacillus niacini]|nr:hypothetical protein [Neobacillus niacini]
MPVKQKKSRERELPVVDSAREAEKIKRMGTISGG